MVAERRHRLTDDLLSDLIRAEERQKGDRLNAERTPYDGGQLVACGNGYHAQSAGRFLAGLLDHQEQWAMLREHPELAMPAVEESMRHSPAVCSTVPAR